MNYYDLINKIKRTALQHSLVNESAEGDVYEWMNSKNHKYPCVFITVNDITVEDDLNSLTANLIYLDRLTDNKDNKLKIQSIGVTVLKQIVNKLNEDGISCETGTYEPFTDEKADVCAGVIATVDFSYEGEDLCEGDFMPNVLEVKKNGEYDVTGYDRADVSVLPTHTDIKITENGTYLPKDYGVDAFDKVEVDYYTEPFYDTLRMPILTSIAFKYDRSILSKSKFVKVLNLTGLNLQNSTSLYYMFSGCPVTEQLIVNFDTSNIITMAGTFDFCCYFNRVYGYKKPNLLDISMWDTRKVTTTHLMFRGCAIENINMLGFNASSITNAASMFDSYGSDWVNLVGNATLDEVVRNNLATMIGMKISFSIDRGINVQSLIAVFNGLADLTGQTAQTLTIGTTNINKLTPEQIAIATNKNWNIV